MRLVLIVILFFLVNIMPVYGLMPSEGNDSEGSIKQAADKINKEKEKIMENAISVREKRKNNLHPFVQVVSEEQSNEFNYSAEKTIPIEPEIKTQNIKTADFSSQSNGGINYLFFSLILAAFLLSYFFIRPGPNQLFFLIL